MICDVTVKDVAELNKYLKLAQPTLSLFNGIFHVQAGDVSVFEGTWDPNVIVIVEFPTMAKARAWYHSKVYEPALKVMPKAMNRNMIVVEGVNKHE